MSTLDINPFEPAAQDDVDLSPLFEPIRVGGMTLRNRIMLPPHGLAVGNPFGTEEQAERNFAYWHSRARDGAGWIGGFSCYVDNSVMIPGFEPSGPGTTYTGMARLPHFRERAERFASGVKRAGAAATAQLIYQGGLPQSASGVLANYINNQIPHAVDGREIARIVDEFVFLAAEVQAAGLDGVELHACHEDLLHLFLSKATNHRTDAYGGSFDARLKIVLDILRGIREANGPNFTIGVRLNMEDQFEGGYDLDEGLEIARALVDGGGIDFLHCTIGNNWGSPTYLQAHQFGEAHWSSSAARYRKVLDVPVVYTGRVSSVTAAAGVLAAGHADLVGMARAMFAEENIVTKARQGRVADIRPCIGTNDCLQRVAFDRLEFGCSVNPRTGHADGRPSTTTHTTKRVLIAGAGPAGLELSALLRERGHEVELWERDAELGGQMRIAAHAPENRAYRDFLAFQQRRLIDLGVAIRTSRTATRDAVLDGDFDVVAVATGAVPRVPQGLPGLDQPFVVNGWDAMRGRVDIGERVLVIAQEDHMQPLTIAGFLADAGHAVRIAYQTPAIAPAVWKYSNGTALAHLAGAGVEFVLMQRLVAVGDRRAHMKNVYTSEPSELRDFDTLVLACGGAAESSLYTDLMGHHPAVHLLGDAYAPRRISFATRQAFALSQQI